MIAHLLYPIQLGLPTVQTLAVLTLRYCKDSFSLLS